MILYSTMDRRRFFGRLGAVASLLGYGAPRASALDDAEHRNVWRHPDVTCACYYYPGWHVEPYREAMFHPGWMEWELLKAAKPQFEGHQQPKVPAWGYEDESEPKAMGKKIAAAADHGIDAFIFDWYYSDEGPLLQGALEEGFLQASNNDRLKFSVMWANHDMGPGSPGVCKMETFAKLMEYVIERYFKHPSYWRVGGKPYFSIYLVNNLIATCGGVEGARDTLQRFRANARAAGLEGLHLNGVFYGLTEKPQFEGPADIASATRLASTLGLDSITSYTWVHHAPLPELKTDYVKVWKDYIAFRETVLAETGVPYHPAVSVGWDNTPKYPHAHIMSNNTPDRFQAAIAEAIARVSEWPQDDRIIVVNAWNEWMEGSYLEPDTVQGMAFLKALREGL